LYLNQGAKSNEKVAYSLGLSASICKQFLAAFYCEVELLVLQAHLEVMQQRAFSVVGLSPWNDLPFELIPC